MKIEVITSFHKPYYDLIGKDSVESFLSHWPKQLNLNCYVEDFAFSKTKRVKQISFSELGDDYIDFQNRNLSGNTRKFSKKAFTFIHAMYNLDADWIIWLDADVITVKSFPIEFLENLLPPTVLSTQMGVTYTSRKDGTTGNWYVPETGFFAVNKNHELFFKFREKYKNRYVNFDFTGLRREYDNDVYGSALKELSAPTNDLCAHFEKSYKTPLKHTILGPYLHHWKAKHSKEGYALS